LKEAEETTGVGHRIRLLGIDGASEGKVWEADRLLRIGRMDSLEIVLDDSSVSRRHAEVRITEHGWRLRDLGSTNGTFLNGSRLATSEVPVNAHDIIRCGSVTLVVDAVADNEASPPEPPNPDQLVVQATTRASWEDALSSVAFEGDKTPRPGDQLMVLLRAGHHLVHMEREDDLLHSILNDAVAALDAQRGAIVLAEGSDNQLKLRALASGRGEVPSRPGFSQNLAHRCFSRGESILCHSVEDDPELAMARSIAEGAMASVVCVLLRTPRKRLGIVHLDRGPFQKPFTKEDLKLADALAAHVSAGIECAQLLHKQRDLFLKTVTILAQAVELRDPYTGGHTVRVTSYSGMLGQQLELPSDDLELIRIGGPLHDIGKIGIDDAILRKPGRLTPEEFVTMQSHTTKGAAILATIPDLAPVIPIVRSHHERWDGQGYPDGLAGEGINRLARVVAVADAFDAMTSDRPYRKGMPADQAFAEVQRQAGRQFEPECAAAFLAIREQIVQAMQPNTTKLNAFDEIAAPLMT
jgi:putative nucleotidyltransferase with HDIG domain